MRKAIFVGLLSVIVLVGGGVYYVFNKPHRSVVKEEPSFTVSSDQLLGEYEKDTASANKKYLDKVVQIKGKVSDIVTDQQGEAVIVLNNGKSLFGIACAISENSREAAKKYKKGEEVTLKGICTGGTFDSDFGGAAVTLNKCEIVES